MTFGEEAGQGTCEVCGIIINSKRFEAGHVRSVYDGGKNIVSNLRCICSTCNKSMGTMNLDLFKKIYFPEKFYKEKLEKLNKKSVEKKLLKSNTSNNINSNDESNSGDENNSLEVITKNLEKVIKRNNRINDLSKYRFTGVIDNECVF